MIKIYVSIYVLIYVQPHQKLMCSSPTHAVSMSRVTAPVSAEMMLRVTGARGTGVSCVQAQHRLAVKMIDSQMKAPLNLLVRGDLLKDCKLL